MHGSFPLVSKQAMGCFILSTQPATDAEHSNPRIRLSALKRMKEKKDRNLKQALGGTIDERLVSDDGHGPSRAFVSSASAQHVELTSALLCQFPHWGMPLGWDLVLALTYRQDTWSGQTCGGLAILPKPCLHIGLLVLYTPGALHVLAVSRITKDGGGG